MAKEFKILDVSFVADNAITIGQILKVTATGVDVATANTDAMIGIAMTAASQGDMVTVRVAGAARVQASAAISVGALVTATTAGQAVTDSTDKHGIIGRALEAATAQNDLISILIQPYTLSV
jgi:hypothetical protein